MCHKEWISAWNSDQQPRFIHTNKLFQQILIDGMQTVPSTDFEFGQIHHDLRINFGIHHEVLHEVSVHHAVLNQIFIHHVVLNLSRHSSLCGSIAFPCDASAAHPGQPPVCA